jgi:hypothetical protein
MTGTGKTNNNDNVNYAGGPQRSTVHRNGGTPESEVGGCCHRVSAGGSSSLRGMGVDLCVPAPNEESRSAWGDLAHQ